MITDEVFLMGTISRLHGNKGELLCAVTNPSFDEDKMEYLLLELDHILVPFFIESFRFKSDLSLLVQLDGCSTEQYARRLMGASVFLPVAWRTDTDMVVYPALVGYSVWDSNLGLLGKIKELDDSTQNVLLYLEDDRVIPIHPDLIESVDSKRCEIRMCLPAGLFSDAEIVD